MSGFADWFDGIDIGSTVFPVAFFGVAIWEALGPVRPTTQPLWLRWSGNIAVTLIVWAGLALLPIATTVGAAVLAREHGWGLMNAFAVPAVLAVPAGIITLDLAGYWGHRLFHAVPALWRLHALHHSDPDLDVATSLRHHPLEALIQVALDALIVIAIGVTPLSAALYSGSLAVLQAIQHGNIALPHGLRSLRYLLVTPELHRVHHSVAYEENNSNFSNLLSVWDRLFGTLRSRPKGDLRVGLPEFADAKFQRLDRMLLLPLHVVPVHSGPTAQRDERTMRS